jgi:glycosyltransferase involved in cell wall biosynthesis
VSGSSVFMAAYTNYRRDPRVRRQAESLVDAGYRVVFLASRQRGEPHRESIDGVDVIKAPGLGNRKTSIVVYIADYLMFTAAIMWHLMLHPRRYRLIHINNMPDFLVFGAWLPRLLGVPVIHDVHDLMPELFAEKFDGRRAGPILAIIRAQERWAGRFASVVLTVEDRLKDILASRGTPRARIHVLMNLPDDRIFTPREPKPCHAGTRFVIVYHGTLAYRLGLDIAVRAVALIRSAIPDIELRIIGGGEEHDSLIALREQLGLGGAVTFSDGFVPVQAIPPLIADADVGLCPLRISGGTDIMLPTKLLEYVAVGIPCIVPRTRTIARYFDDQMVQFFEAESVESLAQALLCLYRDPGRRTALADAATERFGKTHRWSVHKAVYLKLVAGLIGPSAAR